MTTVMTQNLPPRMRAYGCTLSRINTGKTSKFVLENKTMNYRGFIYLHNARWTRDDCGLTDLYANFYYETGLLKVAKT